MGVFRVARPLALSSEEGPLATPWGVLSWSQVLEMSLPGALIGLIAGLIAGGLAAAGGLSPAVVLVIGVSLALPLAFAGAVYELLLATGKFPLGTLAPAALLWVIAFPPIRVAHAAITDLVAGDSVAVPHGWAAFVVYQVLVAVPFAIGFWWLHENFAARWWFHIRERNPVADHFVRVQLNYAVAAEEEKERRRARTQARRAKRR
jgi:hypothetical protein